MEKIIVFGLGVSGISTAKTLKKFGYELGVIDDKLDNNKKKVIDDLNLKLVDVNDVGEYDTLVKSPGIRMDNIVVKTCLDKGLDVISDIELAQVLFPKAKIVAITGTNGKTTTTSLVTKILNDGGFKAISVGNIGVGLLWEMYQASDDTIFVLECSSFQLESTKSFKPKYSAIININPDHLDWHGSYENYIEAKKKIFKNQDENDFCVLNYDDDLYPNLDEQCKANKFRISMTEELEKSSYIKDDKIYFSDTQEEFIIATEDIKLIGAHNYQNCLIAVSLARLLGVESESIRKSLAEFSGVEHRLEFVRELDGVRYYNDSKGTNVDASIKAINSFDGNIILLAGGYDKKVEIDDLFIEAKGKIKSMIVMGETAGLFATKAREYNISDINHADNMDQAVKLARKLGEKGDVVLLSPASASWDMYENFEARGKEFKDIVNSL
ncbi:MAG: UDP-N-acetylmuramoyl-L-alanine--D-glutamate ligase [Finegoldia sp.]|nr:UDP-N-acetylmuramoyl-L-alanine--D-glutamate ligase [Finegoldia sp.]